MIPCPVFPLLTLFPLDLALKQLPWQCGLEDSAGEADGNRGTSLSPPEGD